MTLGGILGPIIGGFLTDEFGFRGATIAISLLDISVVSPAYTLEITNIFLLLFSTLETHSSLISFMVFLTLSTADPPHDSFSAQD
jgi:MFS family permease